MMSTFEEMVREMQEIDPFALRTVLSHVPTSVAIVAGVPDGETAPRAMVIGSFVSVSLAPPLIGFFIGNESTTWPALRTAPLLTLSILGVGQQAICEAVGKRAPGLFAGPTWVAKDNGALSVDGAVAVLEGRIENESDAGDHSTVLLRVTAATAGDRTPIVFHGREFRAVSV